MGTDFKGLDGVKVMVVEDERDVRDFLRVSLLQYGADVTTFATTGEALRGADLQH